MLGGAVGFISYDCVQYFEPATKTDKLRDPLGIPDAVMMFCDTIVIFDHLYSVVKVCANVVISKNGDVENAYKKAVADLVAVEAKLLNDQVIFPEQQPIEEGQEAISNVGEQGN